MSDLKTIIKKYTLEQLNSLMKQRYDLKDKLIKECHQIDEEMIVIGEEIANKTYKDNMGAFQ